MIRVLTAFLQFVPMRLRLPFRYGIVTLREIEHCFVRVRILVDGVACEGIALGDIHLELAGSAPGDLLPPQPLRRIALRHTVYDTHHQPPARTGRDNGLHTGRAARFWC